MLEKKRNIILSVAIVCFGILLVGGTYAYLTFAGTSVNGTYNTGATCFIIDYTAGSAITGTMFQSSTPKGGLSGSVVMNINSNCNIEGVGTLKLNVDSTTGSILFSEGALKYAVYTNVNNDPVASGTITSTGDKTLYTGFTLSKTATTHYVYVWLDGTIADNDYVDIPFSGYIYATATQTDSTSKASGLYDADGNYTSWDTLVSNGDITVSGTTVTAANTSLSGELIIADGITSIGSDAFNGCEYLTSIVIPEGVTTIEDSAFYDCNRLTSIVIPEGVTSIGDSAFYFSGITSIVIPGGVTTIGVETFYYCSNLTSIVIPDSVTSIGMGAFEGCDKLSDVYYGGTSTMWTAVTIDADNKGLTNATIHYNS